MKKSTFTRALLSVSLVFIAGNSFAEGFKRFSVSAGWLHVMPQGKANPFNINTMVQNGQKATVGTLSRKGFLNSIDPDKLIPETDQTYKKSLEIVLRDPSSTETMDGNGNFKPAVRGLLKLMG